MVFEGTAYVMPLLGAYIADSFWGRYRRAWRRGMAGAWRPQHAHARAETACTPLLFADPVSAAPFRQLRSLIRRGRPRNPFSVGRPPARRGPRDPNLKQDDPGLFRDLPVWHGPSDADLLAARPDPRPRGGRHLGPDRRADGEPRYHRARHGGGGGRGRGCCKGGRWMGGRWGVSVGVSVGGVVARAARRCAASGPLQLG